MSNSFSLRSVSALTLFACALGAASEAQSLYGFDGGGGVAVEMAGPPDPAVCLYPNGLVKAMFPVGVPFPCATPLPPGPPPGILGDIAVNMITDTVWVTDGLIVTEYAAGDIFIPAGTPISSFLIPAGLLPGPLTGMGWDSAGGVLWITDGFMAAGLTPPPAPGCGLAPAVAVPAFLLPVGAGPATDIEWDPFSASLFLCDVAGMITNVFPGGAPGPFGAFPVATACPLGPLQGLAFDTAQTPVAGLPVLHVTDGFLVDSILAGGGPAPPSFYLPLPCFATPAPLVGLAFTARPASYGAPSTQTGAPGPTIGALGEAITPNAGFGITLSGGVPGSLAILYRGPGFLCTAPVVLGGLSLYIVPAPLVTMGSAIVTGAGDALVPTPVPATLTPGTSLWVQYGVLTPSGSLQASEGLHLTIAMP